uniref:Uncharacterized protein n=1 Tax=Panagrellus redivivus TaxID=6233 RepID=A0A7E4VCC5_PANRE
MSDKLPVQNHNPRDVIITNAAQAEDILTPHDNEAAIREQIFRETDVFCLMPTRVRCLCVFLTMLLVISIISAIANSIKSAKSKSVSFCKADWQPFGPDVVCPKETMFCYYECCPSLKDLQIPYCCAQIKIWLIIAIISVTLSSALGIFYTVLRYFIRC